MTESLSEAHPLPTRAEQWATRAKRASERMLVAAVPAYAVLLAYVLEHARQAAFTAHFGFASGEVDPRRAYGPLAVAALIGAVGVVVIFSVLAMGRAVAVLPVAGLFFAAWTVLMPPYGVAATLVELLFVFALVLVTVAVPLIQRLLSRMLHGLVRRVGEERLTRWLDRGDAAFGGPAIGPWAPVVVGVILAAVGLVGVEFYGSWHGRDQARKQVQFDVLDEDPVRRTVTVVWISEGTMFERVLDVRPDTSGAPANRWLPVLTTRPLPPAGVTLRRSNLGPTEPLRATTP